ncbi:MAG TPA: response regulator [Methylomirabilota bacterium]|nr:response regulator [Methylomirabilota bacterium]
MVPEPFRDAAILIVDDERSMVRLLEQLLAHAGYQKLSGTSDPREVVRLCDELEPDLVMLDLRMPHLDGIEVLHQLKRRRAETYLPVLVLTADVSRESKRAALEAGASDFVTKPFEQTELLLRVRNLLEMRFLHRDLRRQNETLEVQIQERTHQLLEAGKLATMGNLLAGVAHELNSPLSVILGQVGLFSQTGVDPKARARVKDIGEAAERCVRIVRSFLTMARRHPPERGHVSLNHLLREAVELLAFELRIASIDIVYDLERDLPLVWADGHQLRQVIVNLVTNARQAIEDSAPPRQLRLVTRYDEQRSSVGIEVADSGPGIPAELRARVFEPFFTTKPDGEGTGLGLALVRGIVEGHGGTIEIESAPDEGARFIISLPLGAPPESQEESGELQAAGSVVGKSILVVDDEPAVASLLAEALSRDGYKVDMAANGAVALRMLGARDYDLIISDSGMPELNGRELYREIERREPRLSRRFVFVTGDILNPRTRAFLAETGAPQLEKPFTVESVKRVVRRALLTQQRAGSAAIPSIPTGPPNDSATRRGV